PTEAVDGRAGLDYTFYGDGRPYLPMAYDAGARWDRFDFDWRRIETPDDDQWVFGPYDTLVDDLRAAGITNIVGILLWTPDWVFDDRESGGDAPSIDDRSVGWYAPVPGARSTLLSPSAAASPPPGLEYAWNDSRNVWGNFVYTTVSHFGDRVKVWEMWNEPDWSYFWSGSAEEYARLLQVGYQATKAACPDCQVLFGGLLYWGDQTFYERVLNTLNDDPNAPANNDYFDALSVHLYSTSEHSYSIVNLIRQRMQLYVSDHPIWLTETGVPVWDASLPPPYSDGWTVEQDVAAAYILQSYANALAAGVERYFVFRTHDNDMSEYFGLIRNDQTLRPAYVAYQVATRTLVSPTFTTRYAGASVTRVTLWGTPHGKVSVIWNPTPTAAVYNYPATMPIATRLDQRGVAQTISAAGGTYVLSLPGATAYNATYNTYFIGGEPVIVIETETPNEPPTATVHALPPATVSPTFTVTWEGHDNQSGVWLYDVQVSVDGGAWAYWKHSVTSTSGQFVGESGHTYCFRARATDRLGFRGEWPEDAQACTSVDVPREIHVVLDEVFGDADGDGVRGGDEVTLTVALRFVDGAGADVVPPTLDVSWAFTATLTPGAYTLVAVPEGWWSPAVAWLPRWVPVDVEVGAGVQAIDLGAVGLPPHVADVWLPVVFR
ncbi:MAG: hypothetical protein JXD18_08700, partial [Anaerolineae bacterium]|nr:hypothetical protein [Anaerolineae bacterium]